MGNVRLCESRYTVAKRMAVCCMKKTGKDAKVCGQLFSLGRGKGENFQPEGDDDMSSMKLVGPTVVNLFQRAEQMYLFSGVI